MTSDSKREQSREDDSDSADPPSADGGAIAEEVTEKGTGVRGRLLKLGIGLAVLVALFFFVRHYGGGATEYVERFLAWVRSLGGWAPAVFVGGYALATVAAIPGSLMTMAGGVLFGLGWGVVYTWTAATLGSTLAFLVGRYVARGAVEAKLAESERFAVIDRAVAAEGLKVVFLLRLVPFFPFVWLNYGLGLTRVRLWQYVVGGLGMLPGSFLYVYYGKAIGSLASLAEGDRPDRGWEQWAFLGLGLVAAVAVTTLITRRAREELAEVTEEVGEDAGVETKDDEDDDEIREEDRT